MALLWHPSGSVYSQTEEVLVEATQRCGSWPVEHTGVEFCRFAIVKEEVVTQILQHREALVASCLDCNAATKQCEARKFSRQHKQQSRLCKRVFLTPTKIDQILDYDSMSTKRVELTYQYDISVTGQVDNIRIIMRNGWHDFGAMQLIGNGAKRNHYAPLTIDGSPYSVINLTSNYNLQ